jgi:transcription elongation factor Elf1
MAETHMELVVAETALDCVACGQPSVHDTVLVNAHGMVLLRGQSCASCGGRHRVEALIPAQRAAG